MGGKEHNPLVDDPSEAFGLSSTLWEVNLLSKHFHPHVAQVSNCGSWPSLLAYSLFGRNSRLGFTDCTLSVDTGFQLLFRCRYDYACDLNEADSDQC